jgi:hypothetical protein
MTCTRGAERGNELRKRPVLTRHGPMVIDGDVSSKKTATGRTEERSGGVVVYLIPLKGKRVDGWTMWRSRWVVVVATNGEDVQALSGKTRRRVVTGQRNREGIQTGHMQWSYNIHHIRRETFSEGYHSC